MKRLFFIAGFAAITASASAQTSFGVQAGVNLASMKIKADGASSGDLPDVKSKVGLMIGAVAEIDFGSNISFRPELNFVQKGGKSDFSFPGIYSEESKTTLNYIELSPNFVYNVNAGTGKVFFGLGPSFGFGMSGKMEGSYTDFGEPTVNYDEDVKFGSDEAEDHFKGFDFGLNILAGYKMSNGFLVTAGYNLGLADISVGDGEGSIKNNGFQIRLGYMFGGNKASDK